MRERAALDKVVRETFSTEDTSELKSEKVPDMRSSGGKLRSGEGRACAKALRSLDNLSSNVHELQPILKAPSQVNIPYPHSLPSSSPN